MDHFKNGTMGLFLFAGMGSAAILGVAQSSLSILHQLQFAIVPPVQQANLNVFMNAINTPNGVGK